MPPLKSAALLQGAVHVLERVGVKLHEKFRRARLVKDDLHVAGWLLANGRQRDLLERVLKRDEEHVRLPIPLLVLDLALLVHKTVLELADVLDNRRPTDWPVAFLGSEAVEEQLVSKPALGQIEKPLAINLVHAEVHAGAVTVGDAHRWLDAESHLCETLQSQNGYRTGERTLEIESASHAAHSQPLDWMRNRNDATSICDLRISTDGSGTQRTHLDRCSYRDRGLQAAMDRESRASQ